MGSEHENQADEEQPFLSDHESQAEESNDSQGSKKQNSKRQLFTRLYCLVAGFLSLVLIAAGTLYEPTDKQCARATTAWSPMLDAVQYQRSNEVYDSRARFLGFPHPQLEADWVALEDGGSVGISESQLTLFNETLEGHPWHHNKEDRGGGIQVYFEGLHDFHCLNMVRQYTYRDEYDYSDNRYFKQTHVSNLWHVEHCVEMLRTKVMCEADTTPYLIFNDPNRGHLVDMQTVRSCQNVSNLRRWLYNEREAQGYPFP